MQQRLKGGLFSGVYHIFAVPTMPLAFHSNPVTFNQQGHEKTLVISAYSWRFRKISCNQFRARRRPNNTWTELFSSAESKGSTRQGKAEVMCTEKCALLNISISLRNDLNAHGIKHVVTEQKSPKTYTLCPKVLRTDYLINIKQCITWVNYIKER